MYAFNLGNYLTWAELIDCVYSSLLHLCRPTVVCAPLTANVI